jgi:hypothetical protein
MSRGDVCIFIKEEEEGGREVIDVASSQGCTPDMNAFGLSFFLDMLSLHALLFGTMPTSRLAIAS